MTGKCWEVMDYLDEPQEIEVLSETEKTLTVKYRYWGMMDTRRIMKSGHPVYQTWDEAKAFIVERAEINLSRARKSLDRARSELENAKAMRPPHENDGQTASGEI
jgi:hypothetical protein